MSRAAFLPTPCDPFVDILWFKMWRYWRDEVDKLYVYFNGDVDVSIMQYLVDLFSQDNKITYLRVPNMLQHGTCLSHMTEVSNEDHIMFIEDDGYILKKGTVDEHFKLIESGQFDIVGSPRTSSSMDLQRVCSKKLNVDISGVGDKGVAFWPNFFFVKRADLLRTDLDFNAHQWQQGEYIRELDWYVEAENGKDVRGDTFVWGSIQLRALGLRVKEVKQYHCNPFWDGDYQMNANVFSHQCNWMHAGSLSGSLYGILTDSNGIPLAFKSLKRPPLQEGWRLPAYANTKAEKLEFQRRIAFYLLAWDYAEDFISKFPEFSNQYKKAIERVCTQYELDTSDIEHQKEVYRSIMKL